MRLQYLQDIVAQQIKQSLIGRAKIKKDYAKLKKRGDVQTELESIPQPASFQVSKSPHGDAESGSESDSGVEIINSGAHTPAEDTTNNEPHPDRQTLIDREAERPTQPEARAGGVQETHPRRRERKSKPQPFRREHEAAQRRKEEAEARRAAREEAERQRRAKAEERERFRKAMAKARSGGLNGQRKLGRESKVLLERVKRMTDE
jgi:hypothetical protein